MLPALFLMIVAIESLRGHSIVLWVDAGHALEYSLVVLGPFVATATAYQGVREARGPLRELIASMPRDAHDSDFALIFGEIAWAVVAYVVATVWTLFATAMSAASGSPDFELILAGFSCIPLFAALGLLAARLAPTYLVAPVIGVAAYAAIGLTGVGGGRIRLLSPLIDGEPSPFLPFPVEVGLLQALWFCALAVAVFGVAVLWRQPRRFMTLVTVVACAFAVTAALAIVRYARVFEDSIGPDYDPICSSASDVEMCIHPALERILHDSTRLASQTVQPALVSTGWPTRVLEVGTPYDAVLAEQANAKTLAFSSVPIGATGFSGDELVRSVAFALAGFEKCGDVEVGSEIRLGLAVWLIERVRPGVSAGLPNPPFVKWFTGLSDDERERWLARNLTSLRACGTARLTLPP